MSENYVNTAKVSVRKINKDIARNMVEKYHYSHKWTACKHAFGVYYETDKEHQFFDANEEKLIGVAIYGRPVGRQVEESISDIVHNGDVLELTRLYIHDGYGKNIESYVISQTIQWLDDNDDRVKVLISYADPQQGHNGTIYQASNWYYQGNPKIADRHFFKFNFNGKEEDWIHPKTVYDRFGTSSIEDLKDILDVDFKIKQYYGKHRYIYILGNKRWKRKVLKTLKRPIQDYPKEQQEFDSDIKTIKVNNSNLEKSKRFI